MKLVTRSILFVFLLAGCATSGPKSKDLAYSVDSIRNKIIKSFPVKKHYVSRNGREITTDYYQLPKMYRQYKQSKNTSLWRERAKNHAIILGDRRPYVVEYQVVVEVLRYGKYEKSHHVQDLELLYLRKLEKDLVKSSEKRNVIDDFRAF